MVWVVIYSKKAEKDLDKIPKEIAREIVIRMDAVAVNPYTLLIKLRGINYYKLRVGDYRAIIQLLNKKMVVHVVKVKHRSVVYKRLK